jgi:hypothetical protein
VVGDGRQPQVRDALICKQSGEAISMHEDLRTGVTTADPAALRQAAGPTAVPTAQELTGSRMTALLSRAGRITRRTLLTWLVTVCNVVRADLLVTRH